jgi:uncharacterized membrane protein
VPEILGAPVHAGLSHFPIAAAVFATLALLVPTWRRTSSPAWRNGGFALIAAALVFAPFSIWTGHTWAEGLALLPHGAWLPSAGAAGGILRIHVLSVGGAALALLAALPLAAAARHPKRSPVPAFLATALAAALLLVAGHTGAHMVHRPAPTQTKP